MKAIVLKVFLFAFLLRAMCSPLDDYVQKDDGYYKYEVLKNYTYRTPGVTSYVLNMTSQKWLTESDVPHTVWWHYVTINIPDEIDPSMLHSAVLFISDGNNTAIPKPETNVYIVFTRMAALAMKSISVIVNQVPNCCMKFAGDPLHMTREPNGMVALAWRLFYDNPQRTEFAINFPMTKAAVKTMDTTTDFVFKKRGLKIDNFCVCGGSKRGFAAWSTAAVDKRVRALMVVNYNLLNIRKNFHYQFRSYGGWTFPMKPVFDLNLTETLEDEKTMAFFDLIDPLVYKDRLTLPKFIVESSGDEAFMPDNFANFLRDLKGPTYIDVIPNAEHSCLGHLTQVFFNLKAFYVGVIQDTKFPEVSWVTNDTAKGGNIVVNVDSKPLLIKAWYATTISSKRRDFRLLIANNVDPNGFPRLQPIFWKSKEVKQESEFSYTFEMNNPDRGWSAFFIQMTFPLLNGEIFECTTEMKIIPSTFPFDDCIKEECRGTIV